MQALSATDRRTLTRRGVSIGFGCDVLDDAGAVTDRLDGDLVDGVIRHRPYADVHRTCELQITRALDWRAVWLRPWQSVTAAGHTVRRDLGVFRPAWPELPMGRSPRTWRVTGSDRLALLQDVIGDTVVSPAGARVQDEIRRALDRAQVPGAVKIGAAVGATRLDRDMTWFFSAGSPASYLRWINDLLQGSGIRGLYMTAGGDYTTDWYRPPAQRQPSWTFDQTDPATDIVAVDQSVQTDGWTPFNYWVFLRKDLDHEPTDGDGLYIVDRSAGGRKVRRTAVIDAPNQSSLVLQGNQVVTTDTTSTQKLKLKVTGFNVLEHFDVVEHRHPLLAGGALRRGQVTDWDLSLRSGVVSFTVEVPSG